MCKRIASMLAVLAALGPAAAGIAAAQDQSPPHRESAIVGGKRIQPRADQFSGENVKPDVSPTEAKDIDSLYQQILRDSAAPTGSGDVADPKAAPPTGTPKSR